jgi:hypothetical protein
MRECGGCGEWFGICGRCDRGQRYCSQGCRVQARQGQLSAARQRHQASAEGLADHRDHQAAYRRRLKAARVTDHPSESTADACTLVATDPERADAPDQEVTKGDEMCLPRAIELRCRVCDREAVFLDWG